MEVKNDIRFSEYYARFKEEMRKELLAFGAQLDGLVAVNLQKAYTTGTLEGSFDFGASTTQLGTEFVFGTPLSYGAYVETGTKPHWAPIEPIMSWVETKIQPHVLALGVSFDTGRARPTGRITKSLKGKPFEFTGKSGSPVKVNAGDQRQRAIMAIAKAIQWKIKERGTEGQWFLKRALESMGIPYTIQYLDTGMEYDLDVSGWLAPRMDAIANRAANSGNQSTIH